MERKKCFTVKGKPFFSLGVQSQNSSTSTPGYLQYTWNAAKALGANTVALPIPWDKFEPEEGIFQEEYVTEMILEAREQGFRLVLLWFATWKNGTMEYAPGWVKKDINRFPRVEQKGGKKTLNLSPHCPDNLEADKKAFCRLMKAVRDFDKEENTVIGIQVENEPGLFSATRRDFSRWGEQTFAAEVPRELIEYCVAYPDSILAEEWKKQGQKKSGNWSEVFGTAGGEWVTAWGIARYIDQVAQAGKEIYDIFMYTNGWLTEGRGIAGIDWPAGGPLVRNLDIYYAVCDHLDTISPDVYLPEITWQLDILNRYTKRRDEFPLHIPETSRSLFNSGMMFEAIGNYGAVGYHVFGAEKLMTDDQKELTSEPGVSMMHSFHMLRNVSALLPAYTGTNRIHGIHQRGGEPSVLIRGLMGGWKAYVSFQGPMDKFPQMDFFHSEASVEELRGNHGEPCRGLLFQESENVFYVAGHKFRIFFVEEDEAEGSIDALTAAPETYPTNAEYVSITEGHFDESGTYIPEVYRTGDESRHGTFAQWDSKVLRIEMMKI